MSQATDPANCPVCRGTGRVVLFTSSGPCDACGGTGRSGPPGASAGVGGCPYVASYDPLAGALAGAAGEAGDLAVLVTRVEFDRHGHFISQSVQGRRLPPAADEPNW
jgi:hypothetical protein